MSFILVEEQADEGRHVRALLPKGRKWRAVGDKGFSSDKLRKECYRRRYRLENVFCRIKRWASLSLRRDNLAPHFSSLLAFADSRDATGSFRDPNDGKARSITGVVLQTQGYAAGHFFVPTATDAGYFSLQP